MVKIIKEIVDVLACCTSKDQSVFAWRGEDRLTHSVEQQRTPELA